MPWWQNLFGGGGQSLGAGSGPHPSQHAALTGTSGASGGGQGFWGGPGLPPDHPLVAGGLGLGLGLLKGAQPGGGGTGAALGAGIGGLAQGLLTSHMMRQAGKEDSELTGLLAGMTPKTPGEVGAPPVAGNPPSPAPAAPAPEWMPPEAGQRQSSVGPSGPHPRQFAAPAPSPGIAAPPPGIRTTELPPPPIGSSMPVARPPAVPPPLGNTMPVARPPAGPPPLGNAMPAGPPPMGSAPAPMPQLPMPGMGAPPPSGVGGMLMDQHMQNPGIGGPRMGPPPMAGGVGMPPIASFTGGMGPVGAGGMQPGMQQASMGVGGMNSNDIRNMPPHLRDQFIRNFAATRGGMF